MSCLRVLILLPPLLWSCPPEAYVEAAGLELTSQTAPRPCRSDGFRRNLPAAVRETSGLALSRNRRGLLWTHNDSGNDPVLYAIDTTGTVVGEVAVAGAALLDWEDIASGPCAAGNCLFIADIGDNAGARSLVAIYRVPEPSPDAGQTEPASVLLVRYPDGPQDAEAIFVLPDGDLYLVTKGRQSDIALYRYPQTEQQPGQVVTLERVRTLWPRPAREGDRVTGASVSPNGRWVAIRTYRTLYLYHATALITQGEPALRVDLTPLRERQGEAVALTDEGDVWLTSESETRWRRPVIQRLKCQLN